MAKLDNVLSMHQLQERNVGDRESYLELSCGTYCMHTCKQTGNEIMILYVLYNVHAELTHAELHQQPVLINLLIQADSIYDSQFLYYDDKTKNQIWKQARSSIDERFSLVTSLISTSSSRVSGILAVYIIANNF